MTKLAAFFILAITGIATGCSSSRPPSNPYDYKVAWNEDTIHNWHIVFAKKKGTFTYTLATKIGNKDTTEIYKGTYGSVANEVYLKYSDKKPAGLTPWLVLEASGNYYIQNFTDGRKRMFLKIQQWPHYHR